MSNAFKRFNVLAAAMSALVAGTYNAMPGVKMGVSEAYTALGGYESRGKRKTTRHNRGGNRAYQRVAQKRRNVVRHRRAVRG